jgi:hypothetical protein
VEQVGQAIVFCGLSIADDEKRSSAALKLNRVFLLSPANASGPRGRMVMSDRAEFDLAVRLRTQGAPLGDVFAFISGLYFRGKAAYSNAFASPPPGAPGSLVITAGRGLMPPETVIGLNDLLRITGIPIDLAEPRYRNPLVRDAQQLYKTIGPDCDLVLLGSIATAKYLEPLWEIFGSRLLFPSEFIGRGDMSRGGLMLRCARDGKELEYVPAFSALRRGKRPPKLPKLPKLKRT